jgi:putative SOS response-associated peptidase YedK
LFHLPDDGLFAFAGLWERNKEFGESATIITTSCNDATAAYHDRMPVILDRADWAIWLAESSSKEQLQSLIKPAPADMLSIRPVSTLVNSPKNQAAECVAPWLYECAATRYSGEAVGLIQKVETLSVSRSCTVQYGSISAGKVPD